MYRYIIQGGFFCMYKIDVNWVFNCVMNYHRNEEISVILRVAVHKASYFDII